MERPIHLEVRLTDLLLVVLLALVVWSNIQNMSILDTNKRILSVIVSVNTVEGK